MSVIKYYLTSLIGCLLSASVWAQQVDVAGSWVRATVTGQTSSAAYMELKAREDATLIGVTSPFAGVVEVHEMSMDNGVMKMRPRLDLPIGKTVALKEGSYHIMLMELRRPLRNGDLVPLTLTIEGKDKKINTIEVKAEVRDLITSKSPTALEHMDHQTHMDHMH